MKSATLITTLTSLTTAMAVAAPIVVFGFLYVLQVQPERVAADSSVIRLSTARDELNRRRPVLGPQVAATQASALEEFDARTSEGDPVKKIADALTAALNSKAVGGVANLSIESGTTVDGPIDSIVQLFGRTMVKTPVTVTFDARYEQIGRFFWNLRVLPTTFDLQSVELTPLTASPGGLMRAKVSLLVFHRPETAGPKPPPRVQSVDVITPPEWTRDPFAKPSRPGASRPVSSAPPQPAPVVSSILYSSGRHVALVDGLIVGRGDRVQGGVVLSIEPDAVVIGEPGGRSRRVEIAPGVTRLANR